LFFIVPLINGVLLACWTIITLVILASDPSSNLFHEYIASGYGTLFLLAGIPATGCGLLAGSLVNRGAEEWLGPHLKSANADHLIGTVHFVLSLILNSAAIAITYFFPTMFAIG
jgi:hypothetical protein